MLLEYRYTRAEKRLVQTATERQLNIDYISHFILFLICLYICVYGPV